MTESRRCAYCWNGIGARRQVTETTDLMLLDPASVRLLRVGGIPRMTLLDDRSYVRIRLARAFPISDASHYYAVLDGDGKDVGLIVSPAALDAESQSVAADEIEQRYFVPVIRQVIEAKEDYGAIIWDVETDRGRNRDIVRSMR